MENEQFETVEDLLNNDQFCAWVTHQKHEIFWSQWQMDNPDKQPLIAEATTLLQQLSFQKKNIPSKEIDTALVNIWTTIDEKKGQEETIQPKEQGRTIPLNGLRTAAAILVLVVAGWFGKSYFNTPSNLYATHFGETKMITLPDNSQVVLQANSQLKVSKKWKEEGIRKVWLEGEAFFSVTKIAAETPIKFEVQTDDFTVEVVGTEFDVLNRSNNKRVVLQEGKVRLRLERTPHTMDLIPNEMVSFSKESKKYDKTKVNPAIYTAWTQEELILNNTPLSEIARMLEDNYGYQVQFSSAVDKELTRSSLGVIDIKSMDALIAVVEASYEVSIIKKEKIIEIK